MSDEIDFVLPIIRPQINSQDEGTVINVAIYLSVVVYRDTFTRDAYLVSISFPVATSVMTTLIHGGGVIGRRS